MKIDILTLFPEMFKGPFDESILKRAKENNFVEINIHNLRNWSTDKHKTVDDRPFGGGKGMVIKVDVVYRALNDIRDKDSKIFLLTPQGEVFTQKKARYLSKLKHIILISGHYEGFDERIREHLIDGELSIGNYVLTGGEVPAMAIVDCLVRLIPGVLENEATKYESFSENEDEKNIVLLDYPQYTRPEEFISWKVPEILLSGNHKEISKWRKEKSLEKTLKLRPDLLK